MKPELEEIEFAIAALTENDIKCFPSWAKTVYKNGWMGEHLYKYLINKHWWGDKNETTGTIRIK